MSSCVLVAMSVAVDFGAGGFFSRGARGLRGTMGWPGWKVGASALRPGRCCCGLFSEAGQPSSVSWPPNCRPPAARRCGNRSTPPLARPRPRLSLPAWRCAAACTDGGTNEKSAGVLGAGGLADSLRPPRPRPRPPRPPLCVGCSAGPSSCCSAVLRLRLRGRLRR